MSIERSPYLRRIDGRWAIVSETSPQPIYLTGKSKNRSPLARIKRKDKLTKREFKRLNVQLVCDTLDRVMPFEPVGAPELGPPDGRFE